MTSLIILIFGTFWEASMDIVHSERNYKRSVWNRVANYFDRIGWHSLGQHFWDYRISWKNKWKNGDPTQGEKFFLSSRMLATYMDAWHLLKFIWLLHFFSAIVEYKAMTAYPLLDFSIYYLAFGTFHSFFFRILQVDQIIEEANSIQE